MIKRFLVIGVFFLLIVSSIGSLSFSEDSNTTEKNKLLEDLKFYCTTPNGFNEMKYEYYKNQLLKQDSDEVINEYKLSDSEELITLLNPQLITTLSDGPMDSAWPMKCHDVHHTGLSPYSTADNPYDEKWRFFCDGGIDGGPVIGDDGTIYFGDKSYPDYLYAVYQNGILKWKSHAEGWITSTPAIDEDGTIYVGSWDSYLYAIYPNGTLKWKFSTNGANIFSSPAIGVDGTIYFGDLGDFGYNSKIYAVNPNGTEKWHYTINNRIYSDPAIGDDGTIYIGSDDTYLYAMNPDGTLKWRFKTGDVIKAPPSIANDGTIYIGSYDDYLYALYPNGTMKWKCPIGYGTALNPSIASDGTIYVGWDHLYAVNPNGTIKWIFNMGEDRHIDGSSPAISADGTIYFGTNIGDAGGGEIIAVNPDGTERWRKMISDEWVESSPCIAEDGTIYIGSTSGGGGYLHAFGNVESNIPPEAPIISGETNGNVGQRYWYTFNSVDPDRNPISFYIEWGDDTTTGWTMERASGENCYYDHTYSEPDTYIIRAKVRDVMGEESDWGTLEVTMPRNRVSYNSLFMRFLEQFQILRYFVRGW